MLTLFSIILPEAVIQRDERWSKFETTLPQSFRWNCADPCSNFCFDIFSISRPCSKYDVFYMSPHKEVKRREIRIYRRLGKFTSARDDLVLES